MTAALISGSPSFFLIAVSLAFAVNFVPRKCSKVAKASSISGSPTSESPVCLATSSLVSMGSSGGGSSNSSDAGRLAIVPADRNELSPPVEMDFNASRIVPSCVVTNSLFSLMAI